MAIGSYALEGGDPVIFGGFGRGRRGDATLSAEGISAPSSVPGSHRTVRLRLVCPPCPFRLAHLDLFAVGRVRHRTLEGRQQGSNWRPLAQPRQPVVFYMD